MTTLTYGQKIPATGERGSVWFPALEDNFTRLDSHNHDGSNSAPLTTAAVTAVTASITNTGWGAVSNKLGLYSQLVTMPLGYLYANKTVTFRSTAGASLLLHTEASTSTGAFTVYCNDNSIALVALYGI